MKWSIAVLGLLGVAAAVSAAVLVAALRADSGARLALRPAGGEPKEVEITLAARDLPAMSVLDASGVTTKRVPHAEAPEEYYSQTFQIVGKVLSAPVLAGQIFRPASFIEQGTGQELAAALKAGMRAVSVSLPRDSSNEGVLYPGSIVDVLVALKLPGETTGQTEAVSSTLLQGVQVLAIEDNSIVSGERKNRVSADPSRKRNVTLLVNAKQAVLLQLAREYGEISLALRNPLDDSPTDAGRVLLSELSPEFLKRLAKVPSPTEPAVTEPAPAPAKWEIEIFRGGKMEKRTLGQPAATEEASS